MAKKQQDKKAATQPAQAEPKPKTATKQPAKAEAEPKAKKQKRQSNLELGRALLAEKADEKKILAAFTKAYRVAGKTDLEYIKKRAVIYMRIAAKSAVS